MKMNENTEIMPTAEQFPQENAAECSVECPMTAEPKYSRTESLFAVAFSFVGYFFIKTFITGSAGMGAAIFMVFTAAASAAFAWLMGAKGSRHSRMYLLLTFVFSANLGISGNGLIMLLDFMFAVIMLAMWSFSVNNPDWNGVDSGFIYNLGHAVFGQSFGNFGKCPSAAAELMKRDKGGRNIRNILLGVLMALPATVVVTVILSYADSRFDNIMGSIVGGISLSGIWKYLLGLPISFLIFGIVYAAVSEKSCERLKNERTTASLRIIPGMMMYSSVVPLCIVYVIFFFLQLSYFTSAFGGVLPEEFSASEYARKGFFELCIVSVINLFVIAAMNLFCRYDDKNGESKRPIPLRFFTVLLSFFTIILIATALSKMGMYIARFGLTPKRVYTSWFMLVLTALFALIIARQFKQFNMAHIGAVIFTVMLLLLSFSQTDSLIAGYNISAYESGNIENIDFDGLSSDAVYAVAPLLKCEDSELNHAARDWYTNCLSGNVNNAWYGNGLSEYIVHGLQENGD